MRLVMDVLDGKELVLPLNLSERDIEVFATPLIKGAIEVRGEKSYNSGRIFINVHAVLVFFKGRKEHHTLSWS